MFNNYETLITFNQDTRRHTVRRKCLRCKKFDKEVVYLDAPKHNEENVKWAMLALDDVTIAHDEQHNQERTTNDT